MLCFGRDTDFFFPGRGGAGEKRDGGGNVGLSIVLSGMGNSSCGSDVPSSRELSLLELLSLSLSLSLSFSFSLSFNLPSLLPPRREERP